jgi:hypothetical protein
VLGFALVTEILCCWCLLGLDWQCLSDYALFLSPFRLVMMFACLGFAFVTDSACPIQTTGSNLLGFGFPHNI